MSIQDIRSKINQYLADDSLFYGVLIVAVAVASFGLGKQSVGEGGPVSATNTSFEQIVEVGDTSQRIASSTGTVVGYKNSDKYHLPWCSGANRIAEANKISFANVAAAKAAGYKPAANCPGL